MGYPRRPKYLAKKLSQIRQHLGLGVEIPYSNISKIELDKNEADIRVLLAYARLARLPLERIVDDDLELELTAGVS